MKDDATGWKLYHTCAAVNLLALDKTLDHAKIRLNDHAVASLRVKDIGARVQRVLHEMQSFEKPR